MTTPREKIPGQCLKRFRVAADAESADRTAGIEDLNFRAGDQWPEAITSDRKIDNRPCLTINHTDTYVRRVLNGMRQQRPRIKCHPVGDGADVKISEDINGIIRNIETQSVASVAYDRGVESAISIGWGYWRVNHDYVDEKSFDQEVRIDAIKNTFSVYKDPAAQKPDGSDAMWYIVSEFMSHDRYEQLYPDSEQLGFTYAGTGDVDPDWLTKEGLRVAEYFTVELERDTLYELSNGTVEFKSVYDRELNSRGTAAAAGLTIIDQRTTWRRKVMWYKLNYREVLESREWIGKYIPIIACYGREIDVNGRILRYGMVRNMRDPARMVNYWRTTETEAIALAPKAPWLVAAGQIKGREAVWNEANRKSYAYLEYVPVSLEGVPVPPPQRQPMPQIPEGVVNAAQGAMADLMSVAGQDHDPNQDNRGGQVVSGVAMDRRTGMADLAHFDFYDNQLLSIRYTGIVVLDLVQKVYSTERMQRIIGDDDMPKMVKINEAVPKVDPATGQPAKNADGDPIIERIKRDITVGRYDVVMDTGPGYQTRRQESTDQVTALLGTPLGEKIVAVADDLVMRNMDIPGAQAIADRMAAANPLSQVDDQSDVPPAAQMQIKALNQQLQQMHQENVALHLEIKSKTAIEHDWMRTEIKKAMIAAGVKREDTHVKATAFRDVAEIRVGGSIINTEQEAKHHAAAAAEALKHADQAEASPV
jgi:hypothetical protein